MMGSQKLSALIGLLRTIFLGRKKSDTMAGYEYFVEQYLENENRNTYGMTMAEWARHTAHIADSRPFMQGCRLAAIDWLKREGHEIYDPVMRADCSRT